jgi:methylmalonyl-CoA/ethylmalonyl-CoA epimerase
MSGLQRPNSTDMVKRFLDVGIAVADLHRAVDTYSRLLGAAPVMLGPEQYAYAGISGARFYIEAATISLVASRDDRSPIASFIASRGEGVNHISFEVADIEQAVIDMQAVGITFLTAEPLSFPHGRVIFTRPRSTHGVQIAVVQPGPGVDLLNPPSDV